MRNRFHDVIQGQPRHSIAETVVKQSRGAVHGAGFAIGQGLGFGIQQLAIDHLDGDLRARFPSADPAKVSRYGAPTNRSDITR
jgi:hypothetical protein